MPAILNDPLIYSVVFVHNLLKGHQENTILLEINDKKISQFVELRSKHIHQVVLQFTLPEPIKFKEITKMSITTAKSISGLKKNEKIKLDWYGG